MKYLNLFWFNNINFGDNLNYFLIKMISKKEIVLCKDIQNEEHYVCIGSILNWATEKSVVWGAGFAHKKDVVRPNVKIDMVRGPISAEIASKCGVKNIPTTYADPSLLLSKFYPLLKQEKKHRLGLIPHYVDQKYIFDNFSQLSPEIKIINVFDYPEKVINEINDCEMIISSSLHGLIVANSYGMPSYRIKITDLVGGDGMKFSDYFNSVGIKDYEPIPINEILNKQVSKLLKEIPVIRPKIEFNKILSTCPFLEN